MSIVGRRSFLQRTLAGGLMTFCEALLWDTLFSKPVDEHGRILEIVRQIYAEFCQKASASCLTVYQGVSSIRAEYAYDSINILARYLEDRRLLLDKVNDRTNNFVGFARDRPWDQVLFDVKVEKYRYLDETVVYFWLWMAHCGNSDARRPILFGTPKQLDNGNFSSVSFKSYKAELGKHAPVAQSDRAMDF